MCYRSVLLTYLLQNVGHLERPSIGLVNQSVGHSVRWLLCLWVHRLVRPSVSLSVCLSLCCPSVRPSLRLSACPSISLSVRSFLCPSVRPSVRLSVCLSVCPSVCLHLCLTCVYVCVSSGKGTFSTKKTSSTSFIHQVTDLLSRQPCHDRPIISQIHQYQSAVFHDGWSYTFHISVISGSRWWRWWWWRWQRWWASWILQWIHVAGRSIQVCLKRGLPCQTSHQSQGMSSMVIRLAVPHGFALASCVINAQPLPAHRPATDDNSFIGCTRSRPERWLVAAQYPFRWQLMPITLLVWVRSFIEPDVLKTTYCSTIPLRFIWSICSGN